VRERLGWRTSISPIFNGLRPGYSSRSRISRFSGRRPHRGRGTHFEHKSCAVKLQCLHFRQFLLSCKCTATKYAFPTASPGIALFLRSSMIRALQPANRCSATSTANRPSLSTMPKPERIAAILVAAGRGLRAGTGGPKQYRSIGGKTVIFRAMGGVLQPSASLCGAAGFESR